MKQTTQRKTFNRIPLTNVEKEETPMLKKARIVSMIVLAASVAVTAGLAVENLVLAAIALAHRRERR